MTEIIRLFFFIFTSVPLEVYLKKEGKLSLGTIKSNQIPGNEMRKEADMKKKGRGAVSEQIATVDDIDLSAVSWFDNKITNTL
jgi:hypothetical protein